MSQIRSICVYCGSSTGLNPIYREAGLTLGRSLAEHGIRLVYGGGTRGIMGAVAQGVMEAGGEVTGIIPTFLTIRQLGLHDTLWSLIVNSMLVAYNVVIVRSYFQSIPQSVVESARIDGANDYLILFKLIIPLSKPVLATVALWVIVGHWNDYLNSLLFLSSRHNYTLQLVLKELVLNAEASIHNISMSSDSSTSGAAALGQQMRNGVLVVSMIPMIILYPFVQRYFISGVMLGSVKG